MKRKLRHVKQNTPDQTTNISVATTLPTRTTTFFSRFRRSLSLHNTPEPDVTNEKQVPIPSESLPNYRVRVEMLQLAVLIAMPSPHRSLRKNAILEKLDMDHDDYEKESDDLLPNVVFGVTRVNYRQPSSPTSPLQPKPT